MTDTPTLPVPAGTVARSVVAETKVTLVALVVPNWTVAPLMKLVPVIVTTVPPDTVPETGLMLVIAGAGLT